MSLGGLDLWKCTPPADLTPPEPDPHDQCEREIESLRHELQRLERTLVAVTEGRAAVTVYRPAPRCKICDDGRPNADCTCRGSCIYYECDECHSEHFWGDCLEVTLPGRRPPLLLCSARCVAAALEELPRPPVPSSGALPEGDEIPW